MLKIIKYFYEPFGIIIQLCLFDEYLDNILHTLGLNEKEPAHEIQ